ncbi:hypothetical protein AOQ89_00540 [bacterium endosymbiont of Pedicinus badii]|nr:hypothetical protein AOQ89_00540 [bacterium endosymbiont of Pedicinus badii]
MLLYASRIQIVKNVIIPKLQNDFIVVSDRYNISTLAYQVSGRGIKKKFIKYLELFLPKILKPSIIIYLDIHPKEAVKRIIKARKLDKIEKNSFLFFNKIRNSYIKLSKKENFFLIDAQQSIKKIDKEIQKILTNWYEKYT